MALTPKTLIARDSLFRGLAGPIHERIASLALRRTYAEGEIIFMQGDPGDSLCAVASGRVRISVSRPGGKEVFLNIMAPGETFGEIALLDGEPRTATATAMVRTDLFAIPREPFLRLLGSEPQLATHLIQLLCRRVRWTAQLAEDLALLTVPARVARRLLSLARLHGRQTTSGTRLSISQEELAQFLGLSRQVINQHLQSWKAHGWILGGRGNVTIANVAALERLGRDSPAAIIPRPDE